MCSDSFRFALLYNLVQSYIQIGNLFDEHLSRRGSFSYFIGFF